jgi:hypothetical protein
MANKGPSEGGFFYLVDGPRKDLYYGQSSEAAHHFG